MDLQTLAYILAALGMPAGYIPITAILLIAFMGLCAHMAAILPQSTPQSGWPYFIFRWVLNKLGGNYNNAKNQLNVDKVHEALTLAETTAGIKPIGSRNAATVPEATSGAPQTYPEAIKPVVIPKP